MSICGQDIERSFGRTPDSHSHNTSMRTEALAPALSPFLLLWFVFVFVLVVVLVFVFVFVDRPVLQLGSQLDFVHWPWHLAILMLLVLRNAEPVSYSPRD